LSGLQVAEERDKLLQQMQEVASLQQQLAAVQQEAAQAGAAAAVFEERFMKERAVRRKLHEQLQVSKMSCTAACTFVCC
jgi:hypothetical protein